MAPTSIVPARAGAVRKLVLDQIILAGRRGVTTNECASILNIDKGTVQPRTSELRSSFQIVDSGKRRPNESGKAAIVWVAASVAAGADDDRLSEEG